MILYHGTDVVIEQPSSHRGRRDVDFGVGFYTTEDRRMAQKWACNKVTSIVNEYEANLEGLAIKRFEADGEWLEYVIYNRTHDGKSPFADDKYDIIIGPTADDKLFTTLDLYSDGVISKEQTIEIINCMKYSNQVVFKNDNAVNKALRFKNAKELIGQEKQIIYKQMVEDRKLASKRALELIRERR